MASITLNLDLDSAGVVQRDQIGKHAELGDRGQLVLHMRNGWPAGTSFTRLDFYRGQTTCGPNPSTTTYWTSAGGAVGLTGYYSISVGASGDLTITDDETTEDTFAFKITFSNNKVFDPEVINKSNDRDGASWVNNSTTVLIVPRTTTVTPAKG